MYETESNGIVESVEQLPRDVIAAFGSLASKIAARTVLPWSEHCTECVWPTCYTTCDLYSPREDGRCRRFVDGMVRLECPNSVNRYLLKIRFKQWGKLWTPGCIRLFPKDRAERIENRDHHLGAALYQLPLPKPIKSWIVVKRYGMKKRRVSRRLTQGEVPTSFVLECFNPTEQAVSLSLTIRSARKEQRIPFQKLLPLSAGFQLLRIPLSEIASTIDLTAPFNIELIPNGFEKEITLYFGLMDFVQEVPVAIERSNKIKCVVWDLDHTLWDGVLTEDGSLRVAFKPDIRDIIETLDRRGILQSIASKNDHDEAMAALRQFGLEDMFLYPQISWAPKGDALKAIARKLNIGIDSILFVDDQEFERRQVESSCIGVRTLDATDYRRILEMKECIVPVTAESRNRRQMYRVEQERRVVQQHFQDDYKAFLKNCDIRITVSPLCEENLERVHELTQRTNQMNFSGSRYDRALLRETMQSEFLDTYVLACEDRFGSYGIVGFGIVDRREPRLTDLMFSCRIQAKRVEHAFLGSIIERYISVSGRSFYANYRKTERNAPSGKVFEDLGMIETHVSEGVTSLWFCHDKVLPKDGIIQVSMPEVMLSAVVE